MFCQPGPWNSGSANILWNMCRSHTPGGSWSNEEEVFFLTIMMPMRMVTKCPISKNGVKSDSQVLSLISLCICLIGYSEANSRNNWMRGEQACRGEVALSKRTETNISVRKNTPTIIIKKTDHLIIWSSDHLITWSSSWSPDSEPLVLCSRPRSSGRPLPQCAV